MQTKSYDIIVIGSGAGGGAVAFALSDLVAKDLRILVLEKGPRFSDQEFTGNEMEMAQTLYEDAGAFLTRQGTLSLAFCKAYGGSTVVYTGTSLTPEKRVIEKWAVPDLTHEDLLLRCQKYIAQNNVHLLEKEFINENNQLFVQGCAQLGFQAKQFPINVKGCLGSSLCNLGCPNQAKQGTNRVQLPQAEENGVEIVTRAEVVQVDSEKVQVRILPKKAEEKGLKSEWAVGDYSLKAKIVVLSAGVIGSTALLLKSAMAKSLPKVGKDFTCHPAQIVVGEHKQKIVNDVGHPKSYYLDRAKEQGFVLETCMYFPFVTAKSLTGFGEDHEKMMRAFPKLQMILILACDQSVPQNQVRLNGKGRPMVDYEFTPEVRESLVAANRFATEILFASGATRVHAPLGNPPLIEKSELGFPSALEKRIQQDHFKTGKISISAAHLMGGCQMGSSPKDSVTDSWGRVHGHSWLRVADASLFPNALEINPYLTIMALADRVAEGIRKDLGR